MVKIRHGERVDLIGATGTGKSVMAKFLLSHVPRSVVVDPKHTFSLKGYRQSKSLPIVRREWNIIYRPSRGEDAELARFLLECWIRGNIIIYVDEMTSISDSYPISTRILEEIARTGRERGVSLWSAFQRPRHIPVIFLTEAEVFFLFRLRSGDDRKYMTGYMGEEAKERIPFYEFLYVRPEEEDARLLHLNLKTKKIEEVRGNGEEKGRTQTVEGRGNPRVAQGNRLLSSSGGGGIRPSRAQDPTRAEGQGLA